MINQLIAKLPISPTLFKYLTVGVTAVVVEYGSFTLMYGVADWQLYVANSISFTLGLLTSFFLNRLWTFGHADKSYSKKASHQLGFYVALAITNLLLSNILIGLLSQILDPRYAKLIVMAGPPIWNYLIFKFVIFNHRKPA